MSESKSTPQQNRIIVVPFIQEKYSEVIENPQLFRKALDTLIDTYPEIFPAEIKSGYRMKDIRYSKKSGISTRRILIGSVKLFPFIAVICCFLHIFIKIPDRSKKKYTEYFKIVSDKLWDCYKAESKASFSQRVRRLYEWIKKDSKCPDVILKPITKLKENISDYSQAVIEPEKAMKKW